MILCSIPKLADANCPGARAWAEGADLSAKTTGMFFLFEMRTKPSLLATLNILLKATAKPILR